MSHYSHKGMPDTKFESGSVSIFGDMSSQNPAIGRRERVINSDIYPRKIGLTLKQ